MQKSILYRKNNQVLPFASSIYELFRTKGNTLILGYGYMRKSVFDKRYKREDENDTEEDVYIRNCKTYTRQKFKESILDGFEGIKHPTIKLIGCLNDENHKKELVNFGFELEKLLDDENINIEIYITKHKDYKNKIAMKLDNNNIKLMIIGNSNITTTSLWHTNNNVNTDIDVMYYDKNTLQNELNILNNIENINNSLEKENKYINKILEHNLGDENSVNLILKNSNITNPLEPYLIKDRILDEINSKEFNYIYVKKYKIDVLATIYSYYLFFYKNRREISNDEQIKYNNLKKYYNEYTKAIKSKDLCNILSFTDERVELKKLEFETIQGNINFNELIEKILASNKEEIKALFKRDNNKGFINYYNERYSDKL